MRIHARFRRVSAILMVSVIALSFLAELPAAAATPNAPTSVHVSSWTNNSTAVVAWTAPVPVTGVTITGYSVTSSPGGSTCTVAASSTSCSVPWLTGSTSYTFSVIASSAGGVGPSASSSATTSPAQSTSYTALAASPLGPENLHTPITLTATVSAGATGTVAFKAGGTVITGCATRVLNSGIASCTTSALSSGTNALTAKYSGDLNFSLSASSALSYVISSSALTAAATPLVITSTDTVFNSSLALSTIGGNGSGAITFSVTNGSATGCAVSGASLSVPTNVSGTCLVTAIQASAGTYLGESSNVTTVNFYWFYVPWVSGGWWACPYGGTWTYLMCTLSGGSGPNVRGSQ
jgi:Bacterial Ig-like domain (group 3)/Fibronectin type III domain